MMGMALGTLCGILLIITGWLYYRKSRLSFSEHLALPPPKKTNPWWYKNRYSPDLPDVHLYGGSRKTGIVTNEYPNPSVQQVNNSHLGQEPFPYISRQKLLSVSEQILLKALKQALYLQPYHIFAKVRLADVLDLSPDLGPREKHVAAERVRQKCLDFVICHAQSGEIIGVINLDTETDEKKPLESQIQDKFIDKSLAAARLPLLHLPTKTNYPLVSLQKMLNHAFKLQLPLFNSEQITPAPSCPKCGALLKKMRAKGGAQAGGLFWVCSTYPLCKTVYSSNENVKT